MLGVIVNSDAQAQDMEGHTILLRLSWWRLKGRHIMVTIMILLIMLIVLDIAALRWGHDSRDSMKEYRS
jgi:hypothetical protein